MYHMPIYDYSILLRFWYNPKSVIVGRTQQIKQEVDTRYCQSNGIPVIRRISGGGTVYHDLGNLNTTVIVNQSLIPGPKGIVDWTKYFTSQFVAVLIDMGYDVKMEGISNIFSKDKKISGSAGYIRKGYYLHHSTLLHNTDLDLLNRVLLARESDPEDKRRSRYFETMNLSGFDVDTWKTCLVSLLKDSFSCLFYQTSATKRELLFNEKLVYNLYSQDTWTFEGKRLLIKL